MKTCVIIPTYNESKAIGGVVGGLKKQGMDVLVVDDGSVDGTGRIAKEKGAALITSAKNRGKGASLKDGIDHILKNDYAAAIMMDGDGQHNPLDVPRFINTAEETGADVIVGNRMGDTRSMPALRRMTNGFMSRLISGFTGQSIPDSQCGFRLIKRNALEKVRIISRKYEIESEILIKAAKSRFKIISIPIKAIYQGESSKINPIIDTLRFIRMLISIAFQKDAKKPQDGF